MSALQQVFVRVHFRYEEDRYARELEDFAHWLLDKGYPNKTARTHLYRVQQVLHAMKAPPSAQFDDSTLHAAFNRVARRRWRACFTYSPFSTYLRLAGRLRVPRPAPDAVRDVVESFCEQLVRVRGFSSSTVDGYRHWIGDYLGKSLAPGQLLGQLSAASLADYIQQRSAELAQTTFRTAVGCIRSFLLDCHHRGHLPSRIDEIDLPRGFRRDLPPRAIPWPLVEALLQSIDRRDHTGFRDYDMLHLMAYYGLRTGELAHIRLDSIDLQDGTLTVSQPKVRATLILPLHKETLRILDVYLQAGRPKSTLPWLFVRGAAPLAQMTKYAISFVFRTRARRSGLDLSSYTAYSLRHGFAHRLFQKGVGMKAIGDLMGHRSIVSTSVYLRLQVNSLREVSLAVPAGAPRGAA